MKPVGMHSAEMVLDATLCPKEKSYEWSFIQCPGKVCWIIVQFSLEFFLEYHFWTYVKN